MPKRHWSGEEWSSTKGEWWPEPGRGAHAWRGFGRWMLFGFVLFVGFAALVVFGLIALVTAVVSGLQNASLIVLIPIGVLLFAVLSARRFARTWRPVRGLIRAAGSLADGDYSVRVSPGGSSAVRPVVASFNDMARRLEEADEQRRRLLADLGHELRTPLTVIRGEIEAMLDGVHTMDAEHLEMLIDEVGVMERLLEDLRTLSQIEAGSLALHPEPTDVAALLNDVADSYRRRARLAGVYVRVDADPELAEMVVDPVRIREVLANLVVNALRAMPDGGLLRLAARASGTGAVITVADTGIGIAPEELEHVFDRFHKGSTSSGSGLGLTISRDLVAAHGGSIAIDSQPGLGTTVRIDLSRVAPGSGTVVVA